MSKIVARSISLLVVVAFFCAEVATLFAQKSFAPDNMDSVLYGVAYYPEYMPYDRLDKDVEMMQKA